MKKIRHSYGTELDWVESFAAQYGGRLEGNFIKVPDHLLTGERYFLQCNAGISVFYTDVLYHSDIHLTQEPSSDDFVAIYYNLTEGDAVTVLNNTVNVMGNSKYNLCFIDSALKSDYIVKAGSQTFELCILIKKELIREYLYTNPLLKEYVDKILDPQLNTIVKFTRMSNESYHLLMDLRSQKLKGAAFDFYLESTVQFLLADYIEKMTIEEIVIDKLSEVDLDSILKSQAYLIENINKTFPGIECLAQGAGMSVAKYKNLFKKVTGVSPHTFFLNYKMLEIKRLLIDKKFDMTQIANDFSFASNSYFTLQFKHFFGMTPTDFMKYL